MLKSLLVICCLALIPMSCSHAGRMPVGQATASNSPTTAPTAPPSALAPASEAAAQFPAVAQAPSVPAQSSAVVPASAVPVQAPALPAGAGGRVVTPYPWQTFHYCEAWDRYWVTKRARKYGYARFHAYSQSAGVPLGQDFCNGFVEAYIDIANGRNGQTPAVPPPSYWYARYRTQPGHLRTQQWFEGYSSGAASAEQDGLSAFNSIPLSPESAATLNPGKGNIPAIPEFTTRGE